MIPTHMSAVHLVGNGGFEQLCWRDDVVTPSPGPDDVLIRVAAAGVNNTDLNTRVGWYGKPDSDRDDAIGWSGDVPEFPRIQGADACGHIVAVGAYVSPERVGERVIVEPVFRSSTGTVRYFGSEVEGAFAQYTTAPACHTWRVESALTDIELASFPCSYSAAENMMSRAAVTTGERILITGASGGVGSAAIQLATRRGAHVVAMARADTHAEMLAVGAVETIDRAEDIVGRCGRNAFDVVIDVVGGDAWPQLLEVLRPFGRYAAAGAIGGAMVPLDLRTLYLKDLRLLGCTVLDPHVFSDLVRYLSRGELRPLVAAVYPLQEIVAAQQAFAAKRHVGKIVLTVPH